MNPKIAELKPKIFLFSVRTAVLRMIRSARLLSLILSYIIFRLRKRCGSGGSDTRDAVSAKYLKNWIYSEEDAPNCTFRNGAAMRVSPAAFLNRDDLDAALIAADKVTVISHDHPEGIKGARATTHAIYLAFRGESPTRIREVITAEYGYDLTRTVDDIRPGYAFDMTCQGTVPQAVTCALESDNYEDAVRNAISLGGDSDTLGSIAGGIAEALHGIPNDIVEEAKVRYLAKAPDMLEIISEMYRTSEG